MRARVSQPQYVFLIFTLTAGLFLVAATAPFQAPDEGSHFIRSYQISEGRLLGVRLEAGAGDWLPADLNHTIDPFMSLRFDARKKVDTHLLSSTLNSPFDPNRRAFTEFSNTIITSPLCYLPQALGIGIARLSGPSALGMMYVGRLFNLLCWTIAVFFAIKLSPIGKWTIVLLALMPMALFLAASLSADMVVNASSILFVALVLKYRQTSPVSASLNAKLIIALLCIAISFMKFVYVPLIGLIFLIPAIKFGGRRKRLFYCLLVFAASFAAAAFWGSAVNKLYVDLNGSDFNKQLSFITSNPLQYAAVLAQTARMFWDCALLLFTGVLGWQDTVLPVWVYLTYIPVLAATVLLDDVDNWSGFRVWERVLLSAIAGSGFLSIAIAQYLIWNPVGAPFIQNLQQGRYLIPLALPLFLTMHKSKSPSFKGRQFSLFWACYSAAVLITTTIVVYQRYYR